MECGNPLHLAFVSTPMSKPLTPGSKFEVVGTVIVFFGLKYIEIEPATHFNETFQLLCIIHTADEKDNIITIKCIILCMS